MYIMVVKMIPKCYSLLKVIIKRPINTVLAFFSYWMPSATPVLFYLSERHRHTATAAEPFVLNHLIAITRQGRQQDLC